MRRMAWIAAGVVAGMLVAGLAGPQLAEGQRVAVKEDPLDGLLAGFSKACAEADIQKLESLFLPPDDSSAGQQRKDQLDEARKDFARGKGKADLESVTFKDTRKIIRTVGIVRERGKGRPKEIPIEFEVALTDAGWKIVFMEAQPDEPEEDFGDDGDDDEDDGDDERDEK